jgi:hypothetical protein
MIEWFLFGALGFFLGCLLALILAPPLWNRAVKLTTRKLEATMPMSLTDIQADKDQLRAEFAIELRKVEVALDKAKEKAARELIEANKRRVEISMLQTELGGVKGQLQENQNANRVLQQTIKRRLPDLDSRLKAAKKALADLETVNAELRNTVASQSEALKIARATVHNQRADIDRLRSALESGGTAAMRGSGKADGRALAESQRLSAELSRTQEELERARISSQEIAFLRRELTRLASQILNVTRGEAAPQFAVEMTQAFAAHYAEPEQEPVPETAWHAGHGGNGSAAHQEMAGPDAEVETAAAEVDYAEEPVTEHEAAPEPQLPGDHHDDEQDQDHDQDEDTESEAAAPRSSLAQRFAARRARRQQGAKASGSLTDRLRGLVAESSGPRT